MDNYNKLFSYLRGQDPSPDLVNRIMQKIIKTQIKQRRFKLALFVFMGMISLSASVFTFIWTRSGFVNSGFIYFLSLMFTDFSIVMAYWQNFMLSLLNALPIGNLILFLSSLYIFLLSLKKVSLNLHKIVDPTVTFHH